MKKIFLLLALGMVTNHFLTAQSMLHIGSGGSVYTTNPGFITLKNAKLVNNGIFQQSAAISLLMEMHLQTILPSKVVAQRILIN